MDASISFLLTNLKELVVYHTELVSGAEYELGELENELVKLKIILDEAPSKYKKNKLFEQWESQIREAVYEIEDTIDTSVTRTTADKAKKKIKSLRYLNKLFSSEYASLAEQIKFLRQKRVKPLMEDFYRSKFSIDDAADAQPDPITDHANFLRQPQKSQHIVGLVEQTKTFVGVLTGVSENFQICSIIGMAGLGKTTLAWKIYKESTIEHEFPVRIWVNISDTLNMKRVLFDILSTFETKLDESLHLNENRLIEKVRGYLEKTKFLIVMDDIWSIETWKKLEDVLPTNNASSRVLITTRNNDVGKHISMSFSHDLEFLTGDESWELLQYQVFGKREDVRRRTLVSTVGRKISDYCRGLPLSIVVIGGVLEGKTSTAGTNLTLLENEWKDVYSSVSDHLVNNHNEEDRRLGILGRILSLSYEKLPYDLRNCFLYLGVFAEDAKIHVKKLIRLWIAEGFVKEIAGRSLEEIAHENLKKLINRNLVTIWIAKPSGEAKVCQIHDSVREVCKGEGAKLNLFQEVKEVPDSNAREKIATFRRLCIHYHAPEFFSRLPKMERARSFLCFNASPMTLGRMETAAVIENFCLLRVYDAKNIKFPGFPLKFVEQLYHLRYLTLAVDDKNFKILPEIVTHLWNLQSLIVETPLSTLEVKGDISKMRQLRHFKTHASITFKTPWGPDGGENLQTLSRLSPESCTDAFCRKATRLLTLGIQGDLRTLGESNRLHDLNSVKKLKLVHQVPGGGSSKNPWKKPPSSLGFPPMLKILVLSGTHLEWQDMSIFTAMDTLEELKLKEYAFNGSDWVAGGNGFIGLVCLHIDRTDLGCWTASDDHFPKLRSLYISHCEKLAEIPTTLAKSLELLSLNNVHPGAVEHAHKIKEEQQNKNLEWSVKLEITAADQKRSSQLKYLLCRE